MEYHIALCVKDCLCLFSVAVSISTIIYVPVERNLKGHCSKPTLLLYLPLPLINRRGGGYIGITLSICSSVCVIDCVHSVSPEPLNHILPNLVWWCIIPRRCVMRKNGLPTLMPRSQQGAYIIKIWLLYLLCLLNCCSIATKLGLMVQHHKPECSVGKCDYCIQGQGHSKGWIC